MNTWNTADTLAMTAAQEVGVVTRREDGSLRRPTIIWVVGDGDGVFIRSTNGRSAAWFRNAVATGTGQLIIDGHAHDVLFVDAEENDLPAVDIAYRAKYGQYSSIVDHLVGPGPRDATLQVHPS